jgi:hypothetical protein
MKKIVALLMILVISGCKNQEKENQQIISDEQEISSVKPSEKWDVKKQYDEQGNLIRYDSIYSWSYSNVEGDSIKVNLDSIMDSFKMYFGKNRSIDWDDDFYYFPKNDSLFMNNFFKDDYFFKNWQMQHSEYEDMIKKMDSMRNEFLRKFHPGLMESLN